MRELVYVSERKLRQFDLPARRRRWRMTGVEGEVGLAGVGKVKATSRIDAAEPGPDLDSVIAALDKSERAARRFTDPGVMAGQWIAFRAPLNHCVVDRKEFGPVVLFLDVPRASAQYPSAGSPRLLLHGSPEHLTSVRAAKMSLTLPRAKELRPEESLLGLGPALSQASDAGCFYDAAGVPWPSWARRSPRRALEDTFRALSIEQAKIEEDVKHALTQDYSDDGSLPGHRLLGTVWSVIGMLDGQFSEASAAWMSGYARVTIAGPPLSLAAKFERIVVATPLYVQYDEPPAI